MDAEGPNYRIRIEQSVLTAAVWKRPDVDAQTGATFAAALFADITRLAEDPRVAGVVLDLREAPPVAGPSTRQTLGNVLTLCLKKNRRSAFISAAHATQRLQLASIVADFAPGSAVVCANEAEAEAWIRRGEPPPTSRRPISRT